MDFGQLLDQLRHARGMTKTALAKRAQLSPGYVSSLISGVRKNPSFDTTAALVAALELDDDERQAFWKAAGFPTPPAVVASQARSRLGSLAVSAQGFSGIVGAHERLPQLLAASWVSEPDQVIRILDTALGDPVLALENVFLEASKHSVQMKVLLLDPDSLLAIQRSHDVWPTGSASVDQMYVSNRIRSNIGDLRRWVAKGMNLQVRIYTALPPFQLIACGDRSLIGFFAYGARASLGPQIEICGAETLLGRFVMAEFDKLWERAIPVLNNTDTPSPDSGAAQNR
jgi:transcriptional regulator with XRE-family HTH domain